MATTNLTAWYDDVIPAAPGCPLPVALQKIRSAVIEFCKASRAWRYLDLTAIDAVGGQQSYTIDTGATVGTLPSGTVVAHVFQVNYNGEQIDAVTPATFRAKSETWFSDQGDPECFTLFEEGSISLWKIPSADAAGAISIPEVALAPSETATTVDATIFERYREAIAKGALAKLYLMPGKPYSNPNLGMELEQGFRAACGGAGARASSGRGAGRIRTQTIYR